MQQQTIAIFGASTSAGTMISTSFAAGKHKLLLNASAQQAEVTWLALDLRKHFPVADIELVDSEIDAAWEADIIIAAVPAGELHNTCKTIKDVACRKIFAVVTDAARTDITALCHTLLPHSRHVNIITEWSGKGSVVYLQSEDDAALNRVADILDDAGITAVSTAHPQLARA